MSNELAKVTDLSVLRGGKTILEKVSLTVRDGDFTTVIGPNGAGKSMLLRCLMGFYAPSGGNVWNKPGLRIGYMPQRFMPEQSMPITVKRFLKLRKKVDRKALADAAGTTGIEECMERPLYALSGGELQRVLLARALLGKPELLVLDEPAQNLDIGGQLDLYQLLERIYSEHKLSILMVSHDLHMVIASTRHVVCLFRHIRCSGAPHAVTQDPQFVNLFGHNMTKMLAVYQHAHRTNAQS